MLTKSNLVLPILKGVKCNGKNISKIYYRKLVLQIVILKHLYGNANYLLQSSANLIVWFWNGGSVLNGITVSELL